MFDLLISLQAGNLLTVTNLKFNDIIFYWLYYRIQIYDIIDSYDGEQTKNILKKIIFFV